MTAAAVSLSGGKNGLGASLLSLPIAAGSLSVVSKGVSYLNSVGTSDLSLVGVKSTAAMTLTTASDLLVNGPVVAKSLNLQSTGDILQGAGANAGLTAKTIFASAAGNIGSATQALKTSAGAMTLNATGLVNALDLSKAMSTVSGAAGQGFALVANNTVALSKISAAAGDLTVNALKGAVNTAQGAVLQATDGKLTLQASGKNGAISLGSGSMLSTAGDNGSNVGLIVGATAQSGSATTPGGITTSVTPGSQINYGQGGFTLAKNATATINAHGASVQFSSEKGNSIKVGNGVVITADPPTADAPVVTVTAIGVAVHSLSFPAGTSKFVAGSVANLVPVTPVNSAIAARSSNADGTATGTVNAGNVHSHLDQEQTWVTDTELANGDIPALVCCEQEVGIASAISVIADLEDVVAASVPATIKLASGSMLSGEVSHNVVVKKSVAAKHVALSHGSVVFAPQIDTHVQTPFGVVSIKAHSLVLVLASCDSLGVYDLDDNCKGAVKVAVGGKELTLRPGRSAIVTHAHISSLEQINPAQLFGYRGVMSHALSEKHKGFTCEFSLPQAIKCVQPLKQMMASDHPKARQLANHLLKTTSIMLQLCSEGGEYKQMLRPRTMACLPE